MSGTGFHVSGGRPRYGFKLIEAKCSVCGKKFMRSDQHGYHAGGGWQCSYSCYRIPEEEERRKFREDLDRKLAVFAHSESTKNDATKKQRRTLEHNLEKTRRRIEYCEAMVNMFTERVNRLPKGVKQRAEAMDGAKRWRKNLKTAREEVVRLEKEMEVSKNVQSTPEEEALG